MRHICLAVLLALAGCAEPPPRDAATTVPPPPITGTVVVQPQALPTP